MVRHLIRRVVFSAITVAAVVLLTFLVQYVIPGNPARSIAGPKASPRVLEQVSAQLHLNDSVWSQLGHYVGQLLQGNLGMSYANNEPVLHMILQRLPATGALALAALIVELTLGVAWGVWESLRPKRSWLLAALNVGLLSVPTYALAFVLLLLFGYELQIFPISGGTGLSKIVLPGLTLGLIGAPYYANVMRDALRDAFASPYVRTAVSKGLSKRRIMIRHIARNAIPPAVTMLGMDVAIFLSGVVFVEQIFAWPGIGQLQIQAFDNVDRPLLTGTVIVAAVLVVCANIIVDVVRTVIDPRASLDTI